MERDDTLLGGEGDPSIGGPLGVGGGLGEDAASEAEGVADRASAGSFDDLGAQVAAEGGSADRGPLAPGQHDMVLAEAAAPAIEAPARPRGAGLHTTFHRGGYITFYPATSRAKSRFQATCGNPNHGNCRLTRAADGHGKGGARLGTRSPVGLLAAWLATSDEAISNTKAEHDASVAFITYEARCAARAGLLAEDNGAALADAERPRRPNEAAEPEGLP